MKTFTRFFDPPAKPRNRSEFFYIFILLFFLLLHWPCSVLLAPAVLARWMSVLKHKVRSRAVGLFSALSDPLRGFSLKAWRH